LREAKHILEKDMADKISAQKIDVEASELMNSSPQLGSYNAAELMDTWLVEELPEIDDTVDSLQSALRTNEKTLQTLFSFKRHLECDLQRKLNSIFIDNEKCLGLRRLCPIIA
uniref:Tektin n=1 Tax=Schistocephalus solidus TaxID=70667 RepID=A0A183THB6_SCHSO